MRAWHPLLERLCDTTIWIQLGKKSPIIARVQLIEESPKWCSGGMPDEKWSDKDIALQVVFLNSFSLAILRPRTITAAEKNRLVDSYREQARRLRENAAWFEGLRMGMASVAAKYGRIIESAAVWCEAEAEDVLHEDDILLVDRHQKSPNVRAYCMQLAQATRLLYGDALYGTIASIASVSLVYDVSPADVRYWCENKST
jgi:hypothetical protein